MTARVLHSIPESEAERIRAAKFVEFMGGLGDVLIRCHQSAWYEHLARLPEGQEAFALIISHNPHAKELFMWMPGSQRITVVDVGFHYPWDDQVWRESLHLPAPPRFECREDDPIKYFPSADDEPWLTLARGLGRYIVLADSAGDNERSIPPDISAALTGLASRNGLPVIRVNRDYTHSFSRFPITKNSLGPIPPHGCVDFSGRLSVPGVGSLVAESLGVVCSHSAVCHMAQYGLKPYFLLYTQEVRERYVSRGPVGYMKGIDLTQNRHMTFAEWSPHHFQGWLDSLPHSGRS